MFTSSDHELLSHFIVVLFHFIVQNFSLLLVFLPLLYIEKILPIHVRTSTTTVYSLIISRIFAICGCFMTTSSAFSERTLLQHHVTRRDASETINSRLFFSASQYIALTCPLFFSSPSFLSSSCPPLDGYTGSDSYK